MQSSPANSRAGDTVDPIYDLVCPSKNMAVGATDIAPAACPDYDVVPPSKINADAPAGSCDGYGEELATLSSKATSSNIYTSPCSDPKSNNPKFTQLSELKSVEDESWSVDGCASFRSDFCDDRHHLVSPSPMEKEVPSSRSLGLKPVTDTLAYLSPSKFDPLPLDKSQHLRTFETRRDIHGWWDVTKLLCGLVSLVANIETLLQFPLFLLEWQCDGLVVYLLLLTLVGLPLFLMESLVGSLEDRSSSMVEWRNFVPLVAGLSPAIITAAIFWASKVSVLVGYSLLYASSSFVEPAPWTSCEEWWGPDTRCAPTLHNHAHQTNRSLVCLLHDLSGRDCEPHTQASHQQFWSKYILKSDPRGLRVLGDLGQLNPELAVAVGVVWALVGLLVGLLRSRVITIVGLTGLLVIILSFVIAVRNLAIGSALESIKLLLSFSDKSGMLEPSCWINGLFLLINGLTLFTGTLRTYCHKSGLQHNVILVSVTALFVHAFFLVISVLAIVPLVPAQLNARELRLKTELGYFPLALLPVSLSTHQGGKAMILMTYTTISLSGINLLLGLASSIVSSTISLSSTKRFVWPCRGILLSIPGYLLSLPLLFASGPSLIILYDRYGFQLPIVLLGTLVSLSIFWLYGPRRLLSRTKGGAVCQYLLGFLWTINPILLIGIVSAIFVNMPPVAEPSPLPSWAFNLGLFFSSISLLQVVAGAVLAGVSYLAVGQTDQLLGRAGHRSAEEVREMSTIETFSYKCYYDLHK